MHNIEEGFTCLSEERMQGWHAKHFAVIVKHQDKHASPLQMLQPEGAGLWLTTLAFWFTLLFVTKADSDREVKMCTFAS